MKKKIVLLILPVSLIILIIFAFGFSAVPSVSQLTPLLANETHRYVTSKQNGDTQIHRLSENGKLEYTFSSVVIGEIDALVAHGGKVYTASPNESGWSLESHSPNEDSKLLGILEHTTMSVLYRLTMVEESLYAVGIVANEKYAGICLIEDGESSMENLYTLGDKKVKDMVYEQGQMVLQLVDNSVVISIDDVWETKWKEIGNNGFLMQGTEEVYFYSPSQQQFQPVIDDSNANIILSSKYQFTSAIGDSDFIALAKDKEAKQVMLEIDAESTIIHETIGVTIGWLWTQGSAYWEYSLLIVIGIMTMILLTKRIIATSKSLADKIVWVSFLHLICILGFIMLTYQLRTFGKIWIIVLVGCIVLLNIGYILLIYRICSPLKAIAEFAQAITERDFKNRPTIISPDELGLTWNNLKLISSLMEHSQYKTSQAIRTYRRFVPRDIQILLGKGADLDIKVGPTIPTDMLVGLVSIFNRNDRKMNSKEAINTQWMINAFEFVCTIAKENGTFLATNSCTGQGIQLLYPGRVEDAIAFGVELFSKEASNECGDYSSAKYCYLLHYGSCVHGYGGDENQAFVFLLSKELEYLSSYKDRLGAIGVQMVLTDKALAKMKGSINNRYIGYIEGGTMAFKLYEILDRLDDATQQAKRRSHKEFNKGLALFYKNDFYLARKQFSDIVKINPSDGVARWYVFACERAFQQKSNMQPCYGLFADESSEDKSESQQFEMQTL